MRPDGSLVGTHWGPISAIGSQPHHLHDNEVWVQTPTRPWGSRHLPRRFEVTGPRRTLFRELLRRSEGVPVTLSDGTTGRVAEIIFPVLGFDFWPETLVVGTTGGKRRVPVSAVARIETRPPRIEMGRRHEQPAPSPSRDAVRDSRKGGAMSATIEIEIEVEDREDAVALMQRLGAYHSDLVQFAPRRWHVHAEASGHERESASHALATIEAALAERHSEDAAVRLNGQLYTPSSASGPDGGGARSAADASPPPRVRRRITARRSSSPSLPDMTNLAREPDHHPLPHGPVDVSAGELDALARSREGYDDVNRGDAADFVRFVEGDGRVKALTTFTHVLGKSEGTVVVEREYEDAGKVKIGTRELAFRTDRYVYDPANPDGPDLGFLTALRCPPRAAR